MDGYLGVMIYHSLRGDDRREVRGVLLVLMVLGYQVGRECLVVECRG